MSARTKPLPEGTLTFLFSDVERSTELLERLGRERYREALEAQRELLRRAIDAAGGVEVDCQGDALFAVFPSAAGAVAAAAEAQRALEAYAWPGEARVRVRMGLHTGEAALADGAYVGMAVHRGRRVCEAARGGQVVLSSTTSAVVAPEPPPGVSLADAGEVRLAGFDQPERLSRLVADGLPDVTGELRGARSWRDEQQPLLERAAELGELERAIAAARGGAGSLVVVHGPAGIGKTAVLAEARARAAEAGLTVLQARGSELEASFSYGVVRQLFEPRLAQLGPARGRLFEGAAAHAARLFEPDRVAEPAPASEDAAFAVLHGLYWLIAGLAETAPLLVAVDDLQWSDSPTLRWIAYLARRLEGMPVCVLATVRTLEDEPPLVTELLADRATTEIRPSALSAAAATELVRKRLSSEADELFCFACHRATGGNPLLLHELLRTLAAEDVAPTAAAADVVERLAPDAVARSVKVRLARLPEPAAALARAVAVLGDGAERAHASALAGLERRELAPAAAALARVDLLRPDPPFAFVHPVVRNAVHESIPMHEREQAHARAAELLASAGAPQAQIAAQLLLAPPDEVEGAASLLREAAAQAVAEGGLEGAATYLRRALEEPLDRAERAELLLELAAAEFRLGVPTVVDRLSEALALVELPEMRVRAQIELSRALFWTSRERDALALLERAQAEHGDDGDDARLLLAEFVSSANRVPGMAVEVDRRLAGLDVSPGDGPGARMLLLLQAYRDAFRGHGRPAAVARTRAALEAVEREEEYVWAFWSGIYVYVWADAFEDARRAIDGVLTDARRRGAAFVFSGAAIVRAVGGLHSGALVEAEADARSALAALPHRRVLFVSNVYGWLAQILVERGAVDEAAAVLADAGIEEQPIEETFFHVPLVRARAAVRAARGDHAGAYADALACGRIFTSVGLLNPAIGPWRSDAALAAKALGEDGDARKLAEEEVALAREWGAPRALGRSLRGLGLVLGGAEGTAALRESVDVLAGSASVLEQARALADLGATLRRANRRAEAREHLRQALELAQQCGAGLLAHRAHEELVASGARPRRLVLSGVESLTPSERRVAAMAAEGLSNREIAQGLFVTLRTVEMHLSNAFRKLGITSRTQLPAALADSARPAAATAGAG